MKFTNPIDDEKYRHFRQGLGFDNTEERSKTDAVIRDQPRVAVSPANNRIYGTFVDVNGILKSGLVLADNSDWESTEPVALVPGSHTGKIRNPFITIDSLGNKCIAYEYWPDTVNPEVWVYDERLEEGEPVPYLQKINDGRSPVTLSDRDNDLLVFYKRSDGELCWRARNIAGYIWYEDYIIVVTGLIGDLYIDDVFMIGDPQSFSVAAIILCVSKRLANGRYALYYVRSYNWPRDIQPEESFQPEVVISGITWGAIIEYIPEEEFDLNLYIQMINWIFVSEYYSLEDLFCLSQIISITWTGGIVKQLAEISYVDERLTGILWTFNKDVSSPDEKAEFSCQITGISLTLV